MSKFIILTSTLTSFWQFNKQLNVLIINIKLKLDLDNLIFYLYFIFKLIIFDIDMFLLVLL